MGLIQKIFYFHVPSWMVMFSSTFVCGIASARVPLQAEARRRSRRRRRGGARCRVRADRPRHRSHLGAQGVGRVVAVGRAADVGARAVDDLRGVPAPAPKYGGPGSDRLAAGLALFGMANVPFVYWSVNFWRTLHPKTSVVHVAGARRCGPRSGGARSRSCCSTSALLAARVRLEEQRGRLETCISPWTTSDGRRRSNRAARPAHSSDGFEVRGGVRNDDSSIRSLHCDRRLLVCAGTALPSGSAFAGQPAQVAQPEQRTGDGFEPVGQPAERPARAVARGAARHGRLRLRLGGGAGLPVEHLATAWRRRA